MSDPKLSIGTRKESSLHRSLKFQYSGEGGSIEYAAASYVCDAITEDGELIEVQTGSFGPLKEKIKHLAKNNKVKIIYPIIKQKRIELFNPKGDLIHSRKSPIKGGNYDLFNALVYAPLLPKTKNLTIELAFVDIVEKRIADGSGSWRRKGVKIADRMLEYWHNSLILKNSRDYLQFVPFTVNEYFTVTKMAEKSGIKREMAQKAIYVLVKMQLLEKTGKEGRALVYKIKKAKKKQG